MSADSNMAATANFDRLREIPAELLDRLNADRPSPGALTALRKLFSEEALYHLAADLPRARHKLRNKLLHAERAYADIGRAEMATARPVALYRMARVLRVAGWLRGRADGEPGGAIYDLGCGAGSDFCALLEVALAMSLPAEQIAAGLRAWETDAFAAWCARENATTVWPALPEAAVRCADVAALQADDGFLRSTLLFIDPTRRSHAAEGRPARPGVNDWSRCEPPSAVWSPWIEKGARVAMKVAPSFDWRGFEPATIAPKTAAPQIEAIEWRGEVHELALWWNFAGRSEAAMAAGPQRWRGTLAEAEARTGETDRFGPGRRATVLAGDARAALDAIQMDTLFLATADAEAARMALTFDDRPVAAGDLIAIPAPAVLRMDLAPAVAQVFGAPALAGQPHLLRIPEAQAVEAQAALVVKCGRVVEVVAAREKDLRRALNSTLKGWRWQPQVLGVKGAQGLEKLMRQIERHAPDAPAGNGAAPLGIGLITRIFQSHVILFLAGAGEAKT